MKKFLKKHSKIIGKTVVWIVGIICFYFFYDNDVPDIIKDYDLITENHLECIGILLLCSYLTNKRGLARSIFSRKDIEEIEKENKDLDRKLNKIAKDIENLEKNLIPLIAKKLIPLGEANTNIETKLESIAFLLKDHVSDCYSQFSCDSCGFITDDVSFIDGSDMGQCVDCHEFTNFEEIKQSFHQPKIIK